MNWTPQVRLVLVCAIVCCVPAIARGQEPAPEEAVPAAAVDNGRRYPHRVYFGMATSHLGDQSHALTNNWLIGVGARGYFGATFLNSFGRRAFTGGLERTLVSTSRRRPLTASVGYRVGFVTGYDGRFIRLARKTPILPFVHPFAMVNLRRVGVEVSYTFVVMSVAASYEF